MVDLNVPGFASLSVKLEASGAKASGRARVAGSPYFFDMEFVRREDGTPRERLFKRRIETFCGRPVRSKVGPSLEDLADTAATAVCAWLTEQAASGAADHVSVSVEGPHA